MPHTTNLNVPPYHDDFDEKKDFQKILFLPDTAVQVRELIQLQTMFQKQVERFGDSIYKRGTIVDGCNFIFRDSYPYVKIKDLETDGTVAIPSTYVGMFAKNSSGLKAFVLSYEDGFEATDPDLKTLYVKYINSGDSGTANAFSPSDTLTLYDANNSLFKVRVENGGLGFSNTDRLVVTSAVVVNVSTGSFTNGEYVTQDSLSSNLQIVWIDDTSLALSGQVILGLRPRTTDLANAQVNTSVWALANNDSIRNVGNTVAAQVESVLGAGAEGGVITDASGRVLRVVMTSHGLGYANAPYVSIHSGNNSAGITALSLEGQNYRAKIDVAAGASSVGNGYAFGVTEGVIYQKGYFLRANAQSVVVSKYNQSPNNVVVGFDSVEDEVDANEDTSLNDPQVGDAHNAPGANRLRIRPTLRVVDKDDITPGDGFFPIVEWSEGQPTKINQTSSYSRLGDEMAARTEDSEGDFVVDRFVVTTRSPSNNALEGTKMDVVVDPGTAYVSGYKVQTLRNSIISIDKGTDNLVSNNQSVSLSYGNYIRVSGIGGSFQFHTGDVISLRDTAKNYLTSYSPTITAAGTQIGTARARSLVYESGVPGTPSAVYRIYLFDIRMSMGKNFRNVKSVFYDGTNKGVADVVLEQDPTTEANVAILKESGNTGLLFPSGALSLKNANNATYRYRTNNQGASIANTGLLTESLASNPDTFFIRSGALTDDELQDLYVVPLANTRFSTNAAGTVALLTTSPNVVGTSTTFISDFEAGDYVYLSGNSTENVYRRVVSVVNNTLMILDSNSSFANTGAAVFRGFPAQVPVPFGRREGLTGNVDANGNIMTLNFGGALAGSASINVAFTYDVERRGVTPGTKSASRDRYVKISIANNAGGTQGPWCLGIPDVFRLKAVYVANTSTVNTDSTNAVDDFVVDANQNEDFLDLSYLVKRPGSSLNLTSDDWLLVKFDHFTVGTPGFYATPSYVSANAEQVALVDSDALANLGTLVSTYEIPEVYTASGREYDLVNTLDFRPTVTNTVVSTTNAAAANVNPNSTISFGNTADPSNNKRFPTPGSEMIYTADQYLGRKDSVIIGVDGNISVLRGVPAVDPNKRVSPSKPDDSMLLEVLSIPPYPTLPANESDRLNEILLNRRINERYDARIRAWTSVPALSSTQVNEAQPTRFTQRDIGSLSRRIEALEYYTSLTFLETDVKDRVIPSSVDGSINRFKFGFFVDDYITEDFLEVENPQHAAAIEESRLVPDKMDWSVLQDPGGFQHPPYVDWVIVDQNYATGNAVNTCVTNTVTSNTILYAKNPDNKRGWRYSADTFDYSTTNTLRMGNTSGSVTLFFDFHNLPDKLTVYRGNTAFKTLADSVNCTSSEKTALKSNTFNNWFKDFPGRDKINVTGDFYTGCGKIQWTHDPSLGNDYTIVVGKGPGSYLWRYAIQYPISTETITCTPNPNPNPNQGFYNGVLKAKPFSSRAKNSTFKFKNGTSFEITCTGLKPNTRHDFKIEGELQTGDVIIDGIKKSASTDLITDSEGKIVFICNISQPFKLSRLILKRKYTFEMMATNSYAKGNAEVMTGTVTSSYGGLRSSGNGSASQRSSSAGYGYGSQSGGSGYSWK